MSKGTIAPSLNYFAGALKAEKLCMDISPINDIVTELRTRKDAAGFWGYKLQKLQFNIKEVPRGTMPNNIHSLKIVLSVEIHEKAYSENVVVNPVIVDSARGANKSYSFSIEISGLSEGKKVLSHWHLDFDSSSANEYIHPDFHLTFGGEAMIEDGDDENQTFGKVLILPSPRLSHPPMDAILGIDFIIRNFVKKDVSAKLTNNPQYKNAVKASQHRLWRPYMLATASYWCKFTGCKFSGDLGLAVKFFPTLGNN